ncbi:MAG: hypothetical protein WKF84_13800 [Pyrinomonadaceae bacterium]
MSQTAPPPARRENFSKSPAFDALPCTKTQGKSARGATRWYKAFIPLVLVESTKALTASRRLYDLHNLFRGGVSPLRRALESGMPSGRHSID